MRHTFVLDENVVISATTLQHPQTEQPDRTCFELVDQILQNCHRIAWSVSVNGRWSHKVQELRKAGRAIQPTFMKVFSLYQFNAEKCPLPEQGDPPPLEDEHAWTTTKLPDDAPFIRLAVFFQCFLVTADDSLRAEVTLRGYKCRALSHAEALEYARAPST